MNRPISTRAHAMIDYVWASVAAALPQMMNGASSTARLVRHAATAAGLNATLTNYEAGTLRLMPMKGHRAVEALMCAALMLSPLFLPRSERRFAAVPVALGVAGLLTSALTETESAGERRTAFTPSRELSEAVADPEAGRTRWLRSYGE